MIASEETGEKEQIKYFNQKFKDLGPIIESMIQNNYTCRPTFSEIKIVALAFSHFNYKTTVDKDYLRKILPKKFGKLACGKKP